MKMILIALLFCPIIHINMAKQNLNNYETILIDRQWTKVEMKVDNDLDGIFDNFTMECEMDNSAVFQNDGIFRFIEGQTKCDTTVLFDTLVINWSINLLTNSLEFNSENSFSKYNISLILDTLLVLEQFDSSNFQNVLFEQIRFTR